MVNAVAEREGTYGPQTIFTIKAKGMTSSEKAEIAALVDGLAQWFASHDD
jgi:hypothetical protein